MTASKHQQAIIAQLKNKWRAGAKWCIIKNIDGIYPEEINCFGSYSQAAELCEAENRNYTVLPYKIYVISDLLKRIQACATKGKRETPEEIEKTILCEKYPPLSFPIYSNYLLSIKTDQHFPIIWSRIINPLVDISEYLVMATGHPNTVVFNNKDYYPILDYFMKRCGSVGMANCREELTLQAKIGDATFNRYLELYRFYYHAKRACYILGKRIDGSKPFLLPITYFARYNQRLKRMVFFDENLKQVAAGKIIGEMDVRHFAIERNFKTT